MNSGHQNTATESSDGPRETRFNALDILARLPDLSRDQPLPHSRSSQRHKKRPREMSLRLLGGSVVGLFVLAIVIPCFWGGSNDTSSLPEKAAASFESDAPSGPSETGVQLCELGVTPIAQAETAPGEASNSPTAPLDASEFEKALGVVKAGEPSADPAVAPIQPFVVSGETGAEPQRAAETAPAARRPLAPRYGSAPDALAAGPDHTPWNPSGRSYSAPGMVDNPPRDQASPSADYTPWQPGMAAGPDAAYSRPSEPQPRTEGTPSYTPWSGTGGPVSSAEGPAPRGPAYTAMNPSPSRAPAAPSDTPSYQNPSPVWNPGNPYTAPNPAPGDVSPARTPYQQ